MTTALLLSGNLCDDRLWLLAVRQALSDAGLAVAIPALTQPSIAAMAATALAAAPGRVLPIGFSMGAIVAAETARVAPTRLAGMVFIAANFTADLPERAAARPRHQARVRGGELPDIVERILLPSYFAAPRPELAALVRSMATDAGVDGFVAQSEALRLRSDLTGVLPGIAVPTLLIVGEMDRVTPPAIHRGWAAAIPGARLEIVAGAGHLLPLEAPETLAGLLAAWCAEILIPEPAR